MASMARTCLRPALCHQVRKLSTSSACSKKIVYVMNDPLEHATGPEKFQLMAEKAGNDDPFFMRSTPRGAGTREQPNIVDSLMPERLVGCLCNEGDTSVKWMWLVEGQQKRCYCGHWFKLKHHPAPDMYQLPK